MAEYTRAPHAFTCRGMVISKPCDTLAENEYRALYNVRKRGKDQIWGRMGLTLLGELPDGVVTPIHSLRYLRDEVPEPTGFPGAFTKNNLLIGSGTKLFMARSDVDFVAPANIWRIVDEPVYTGADWSGSPLAVVVANSDYSPRPFFLVADTNKIRKVNSAGQSFQAGVAPPNFMPVATITGGIAGGPDVGETGNPYLYRFRARTYAHVNTGVYSNPGPAIRLADGVSPREQEVVVTITAAHPDPQVVHLDIERWGGSLPEWIWVGTVSNVAGSDFTDQYSDADLAANPRLPEDKFQLWPSIDIPREGTCTIAGKIITRTGGDLFKPYDPLSDTPYWAPGSEINVFGETFHLARSPDDAYTLEVVEDASSWNTGGVWEMPAPILLHKPLPCIWGPWGGGQAGLFYFACGEAERPGLLRWTNGNDAETASDANELDVVVGEPLVNGCIYDERSFVFSTQRLYAILPNFGNGSDFITQAIPGTHGLLTKKGLCTGKKIWYLSRDGIYETTGGPDVSITDGDLYHLFPHETDEEPFSADGLTGVGVTFTAIDFSALDNLRLFSADGLLYFEYKDINGVLQTLVRDTNAEEPGWISRDTYNPGITIHYAEEKQGHTEMVLASEDGRLFRYAGYRDVEAPIASRVRTGAFTAGDRRARKQWGDGFLDFDEDCEELTIRIGFDNFSFFSDDAIAQAGFHGRQQMILEINDGSGQYAANMGLDISWAALTGQPKLYNWESAFIPKPEVTGKRVTDWTDDGYPGDKFFQGLVLTADTLNAQRVINVIKDGRAIGDVLTITHDGESQKAYSFVEPFISHMVRLAPQDADFWRLLGVRWIWEPMPELVYDWATQSTNHDLPGFFQHRDGRIALMSTDVVTLTVITAEGTFAYPIPSTAGRAAKPYVIFAPMKTKLVEEYHLSSPAPFRLFQKDCEIRVKAWGDPGPFQTKYPFGDTHRVRGAAI